MTDFVTFARLHGVLIDRLQEDGRWHRVPTETHPRKKNGAYRFMGTHGHVQDHASMTEPAMWQPDEAEIKRTDPQVLARRAQLAAQAAADIKAGQQRAAAKAGAILKSCERGSHPYLAEKGHPEWSGLLWRDPDAGDVKLCIPMRIGSSVVGVQTISDQPAHERTDRYGEIQQVPAFEKRFLYGQRINDAVFMFGAAGVPVFCEGFATGLSVFRAVQAMKIRCSVIVTFNAGNLARVAKRYGTGVVVADHDKPGPHAPEPGGTGLKVARDIGLPFWHSDIEGEDANDFEKRRGTLALGMGMRPMILSAMREARSMA